MASYRNFPSASPNSASQNTISENSIADSQEDGIWVGRPSPQQHFPSPLPSSSSNKFSENEVSDSGVNGIFMDEGSSNNLIVENEVEESSECDLKDLGTGNIWKDNEYETACGIAGAGEDEDEEDEDEELAAPSVHASRRGMQARHTIMSQPFLPDGDGKLAPGSADVHKLSVTWGDIKSRD